MFNENHSNISVPSNLSSHHLQEDNYNHDIENNRYNTINSTNNSNMENYFYPCLQITNIIIFYANNISWIVFSLYFMFIPLLIYPVIKLIIAIGYSTNLYAMKISGRLCKIFGVLAFVFGLYNEVLYLKNGGSGSYYNVLTLGLGHFLIIVGLLEYLSGVYFTTIYNKLKSEDNQEVNSSNNHDSSNSNQATQGNSICIRIFNRVFM